MKKLFLFVCVLFASQFSSAQNKVHEIGIEGGPNIYHSGSTNQVGFLTGITYQLTKNNRSTFYTGVFFEEKKYHYEPMNPLQTPDPVIQPDHIYARRLSFSIPVMYRYSFCPNCKVQPFISAGGVIDIRYRSIYDNFGSYFGTYPSLSATLGTGFRANITGRLAISLEYRALAKMFEYNNRIHFSPSYGSLDYTSQLLAGISYQFGK